MTQDKLPITDSIEIARREQELRDAEAFAIVLEKRTASAYSNARYRAPDGGDSSATGIIGWLIKRRLARDEVQANFIMLGFVAVMISITFWFLRPIFFESSPISHAELGQPRPGPASTQQ